jgi:hypothetical protein
LAYPLLRTLEADQNGGDAIPAHHLGCAPLFSSCCEPNQLRGDWPQLQRVRLDDFEADIMSIEKDGSCNPATWIDDGEKYALVGLSAKVEEYIPFQKLTSSLWVLADTTFNIPPYWREWLGSIRADEVQNSNLFLLSKLPSLSPDLDGENEKLKQRVWYFYVGLLLASSFAPAHKPVMLTGSRRDGEVDVRQQQDLDCPIPSLVGGYPPILAKDIQLAAELAGKIDALGTAPLNAAIGGCSEPYIFTWRRARMQIFLVDFTNTPAVSMV